MHTRARARARAHIATLLLKNPPGSKKRDTAVVYGMLSLKKTKKKHKLSPWVSSAELERHSSRENVYSRGLMERCKGRRSAQATARSTQCHRLSPKGLPPEAPYCPAPLTCDCDDAGNRVAAFASQTLAGRGRLDAHTTHAKPTATARARV